jgi:transposase
MAQLRFVHDQIKQIEAAARLERMKQSPQQGPNSKLLQLARIRGVGLETADMLVHEMFSRDLRDHRTVARYAGLTGSPDESGSRREKKASPKRVWLRHWGHSIIGLQRRMVPPSPPAR